MAPPQPYTPADRFPNLTGTDVGPDPTVLLQDSGDELLWYETWRNDYTILTASNTTPVVITTDEPFAGQLTDGQPVWIQDVSGATINGFWNSINVLTPTTFELVGSTAAGAGTGGRVYELSLGLFAKIIDGLNYLGVRLLGTAYTTGVVSTQGRKTLSRPRVSVPNTGGTYAVTDGDIFELANNPTSGAVVFLAHATPPADGEEVTFLAPGLVNVNTYQFQRIDTTVIATMYGTALQNTCPSATFQFSGGVWRLGSNSGWVQAETQGVLVGPGA